MKPALKYFILFLLLIAFLPYLVICFYAFPFADDFCFGWTASEKISFLQKFLNQYLYWNGRYTADVLVNLHPLVSGRIINYQLSIFAGLIITPIVLWFLIRLFITDVITSVSASLFIILFYLNYQPNLTEGIYWFIGISNYHLGILVFILHLAFLIKAVEGKSNILLLAISFVLLVISIGFNEIGALLFPCFYLIGYLLAKRKELFIFFTGALIASAFVFFSPGNFVRTSEFENRYDLLHSLFYSSLQTVRFIGTWILNVPFLLLSLAVIVNTNKIQSGFLKQLDYRIVLVFLLLVVFTGSFLPYFATGVLGQHRTINFVFFFFILLWILFLISASEKFLLHQKLIVLKNEKVTVAFFSLSILVMMLIGNGYKIINDFRKDNFKKYETAFYQRQKNIIANTEIPIEKLNVIPETFTVVDVKGDTSWWVDKCMKKYYLPRP